LDREQGAHVGKEKDEIKDKFKNDTDTPAEKEVNASLNAKETNKLIYEALTYLEDIYPDSECYEEANALLEEIKAYVGAEEFFEKRKKYEDAKELEAMRFRAVSDMANAALQMDIMEMRERQRSAAIQIIK
jgi:CRISPR/Cas system-associated endonuclease/helicase Cas3